MPRTEDGFDISLHRFQGANVLKLNSCRQEVLDYFVYLKDMTVTTGAGGGLETRFHFSLVDSGWILEGWELQFLQCSESLPGLREAGSLVLGK